MPRFRRQAWMTTDYEAVDYSPGCIVLRVNGRDIPFAVQGLEPLDDKAREMKDAAVAAEALSGDWANKQR